MTERNERSTGSSGGRAERLCHVSVNKIFDSAKDKDCLADLPVRLCDRAQEVVDRASAVRCTDIEVAYAGISLDEVPFNRGFYQVTVRYFFCVTLECCVCNGKPQTVKGLCTFDKKLVLYGSEKNVSVFRSDPETDSFCVDPCKLQCRESSTLPSVILEVARPICLDLKVKEPTPAGHCGCCLPADAIPEAVRDRFDGDFSENGGDLNVTVSIGLFSVIRMERSVQLILPASDFSLPEKDSTPAQNSTDPCSVFSKMSFPLAEFYPYVDSAER